MQTIDTKQVAVTMRAPRVLAWTNPRTAELVLSERAPERPNYTLIAHTRNFHVYSKDALGTVGAAIASSLAKRCETDYTTLLNWFGVTPGDLPFNVYVVDDVSGALHYGCADPEIYVGAIPGAMTSSHLYCVLLAAQMVDVFGATLKLGWNCGHSNGEALSRVLACALYPDEAVQNLVTAVAWLDETPAGSANRFNWVDRTEPTDIGKYSVGCSVLFLNWLHKVCGYPWSVIVRTAGSTLGETFKRLSSAESGWAKFSAYINERWPPGQPCGLSSDNPFDLKTRGEKR